ncbi:MAG TPA: hypothetical protein DD435_03840 [Cyanobacteria bacterium UBA8530]|nr:hypothetical protein [Cyanobacteria bacterium UBA8530]
MKRWLRWFLLAISSGSLVSCATSWLPEQAARVAPSADISPDLPVPLYAAPAPTPNVKGLSYDEYVEMRFSQIRWIKAPAPEEVRTMRESLYAEARELDRDNNGLIEPDELR